MVGRDKLRIGDLENILSKHGADGWELASLIYEARATDTCSSSSGKWARRRGQHQRGMAQADFEDHFRTTTPP